MRLLNNIYSFIRHYGFSNFLLITAKKFFRKISLLKFSYLIKSGRINSPDYVVTQGDKISAVISEKDGLGFEKNIRTIKQNNLYPEEVKIILAEADNFCNNTFNVLNSGWTKWEYKENIDWHSDKKTNYRFNPDTHYSIISAEIKKQLKTDLKIAADLKVPRELSRFHFLFGLYFAYIYSGEERYLFKIQDSIQNWIDTNPPYQGINWSNAMEAAIRITNWTLIIFALKDIILKDEVFAKKFYTSLFQHNLFIEYNMENLILLNNHYISDVAGLFVSNLLFPLFKKSNKWLRYTSKTIKEQMVNQIRHDGGDFESSTPYQRLVTELAFLPIYLSRHFKYSWFNKVDENILKSMFNFVLNIIKPSTKIIQFGDNDDGRMFKLYDRPSLEHGYLLSLSYGLFQDQKVCLQELPFDILAYVFYGEEQYQSYVKNQKSIYSLPAVQFKDSGIYILRNDAIYLAVSCLPNGQNGYGVHTHNDKLSFELTFGDIDIIIDPGTYLYASDKDARNEYRSTRFHNTVMENLKEQNDFGEDVFRLKDDAKVQVLDSNQERLLCQHNGFLKKSGSIHQRQFDLTDSKITITDSLERDLPSQSFLHFAENIILKRENDKINVIKDGKAISDLFFHNAETIQIEKYLYSPAYAVRIPCFKITIDFTHKLKIEFINLN